MSEFNDLISVQLSFRFGEGTDDEHSTSVWITDSATINKIRWNGVYNAFLRTIKDNEYWDLIDKDTLEKLIDEGGL